MRDVYKIVAYFAAWQKLGSLSGKRAGDDHYSTSGLCPIYPGWEKSIVLGTTDGRTAASRGKFEYECRSTEFSHVRLIMTHTVAG
jgi:hypothetical protein